MLPAVFKRRVIPGNETLEVPAEIVGCSTASLGLADVVLDELRICTSEAHDVGFGDVSRYVLAEFAAQGVILVRIAVIPKILGVNGRKLAEIILRN